MIEEVKKRKEKDEIPQFPKNVLKLLRENIVQINSLKGKIESLEKKNYLLQNQIFDLKTQNKILTEIELQNKDILEEKKKCEYQIEELKSQILNIQ